jgi:hypothetical protein
LIVIRRRTPGGRPKLRNHRIQIFPDELIGRPGRRRGNLRQPWHRAAAKGYARHDAQHYQLSGSHLVSVRPCADLLFLARIISEATVASKEIPMRGRDRLRLEKDRAPPEHANIGRIGRVLDTILNADRNLAWGLRSPLSGDMPKNRVRFTKGAACLRFHQIP